MNVNLYRYNNSWLMVDLGISFPDDTMPGIDVLLPDIRYIEDRKDQLEALILTHAHEDHFGAIPYLEQAGRAHLWHSLYHCAVKAQAG